VKEKESFLFVVFLSFDNTTKDAEHHRKHTSLHAVAVEAPADHQLDKLGLRYPNAGFV
jgi:hypothetical protein